MDDRERHGSIQPINILKAIFKGSPPAVFSKNLQLNILQKYSHRKQYCRPTTIEHQRQSFSVPCKSCPKKFPKFTGKHLS